MKTSVNSNLFDKIAEGDQSAFTMFYHQYSPLLMPIYWRCVEANLDPKEIIQLTFIKVWLNRDRLGKIEKLTSWITRIAYREYLMALRQKMTYESKMDEFGENNEQLAVETPHQSVLMSEVVNIVQQTLQALSPQRKLIYSLSRNEGMSISEIAAHLQLSVSTVKNTLTTVQQQLRAKLTEAGYGPAVIFFLFFLGRH